MILVKRVSAIDIDRCLHCGGTLKIIAAIEDPAVIAKILSHLSEPILAPIVPLGRANLSLQGGNFHPP